MNSIERRKLRESGWEGWSMTFHDGLSPLWEKVKERKLHPMDLCVASFLQSHMSITTGRIEVRTKDIAEELGLTASQLTPAIKRLRTEMLLAKGLRGTGYFWMLNPSVWHVGGKRNFDARMAIFSKLVSE
jgi:hypothetical protein